MNRIVLSLTILALSGITHLTFAQEAPRFVEVAGGTFKMGDELGTGSKSERPLHQVTLSRFRISATEITVAQYRAYCQATDTAMPDPPEWGWIDNHPIVNINWFEATAYCKWLSRVKGQTVRLPTEAEWEFAARGGTNGKGYRYSGSNVPGEVAWHEDDAKSTQPVATKKANELGLYDMTGNAREWCKDYFGWKYYSAKAVTNPQGPDKPDATAQYVQRGGSWNFEAAEMYNAMRMGGTNERGVLEEGDVGFRVVMEWP